MPIRRNQGKLYPENYRALGLPGNAASGAQRGPKGGYPGRRRTLKSLARSIPWLKPEETVDWLRPFVAAAQEHAFDLAYELGEDQSASLNPLITELASARMIYQAQLSLAAAGDRKALAEARSWLKECRAHALAFEGMRRNVGKYSAHDDDFYRTVSDEVERREFQKRLVASREEREAAQRAEREASDIDTSERADAPVDPSSDDGNPDDSSA